MEDVVTFGGAYSGKRVWLSGHTGFKGAWLAEWLLSLGAEVTGFALPPQEDSLFGVLGLASRLRHEVGDVRDAQAVEDSLRGAAPDFVFHLAAQPLVRLSYEIPVETYAVNVMGTVHVLDALRRRDGDCAAVFVTTDKCYENREWDRGYHEEDPLGGHDPYSSSKGMAELAIDAYRRSFFGSGPVRVASARAGTVIGGGDWSRDRIVPDCVRALRRGEPVGVRNRHSTRPWQHVLEPLCGYLTLGAALARGDGDSQSRRAAAAAFNFGPAPEANRSVAELVAAFLEDWEGTWTDHTDSAAPHEAGLLHLDIDKARRVLGWSPVWDFAETVRRTAAWYRLASAPASGAALADFTRSQIADYAREAKGKLSRP